MVFRRTICKQIGKIDHQILMKQNEKLPSVKHTGCSQNYKPVRTFSVYNALNETGQHRRERILKTVY